MAKSEGTHAAALPAVEVDVKFVIVPEGFSHIRRLSTALSLQEVKEVVEQDLRIPVANMKMFFQGQGDHI